MPKTSSSCDLLVVGGGIAGCFLSALLGSQREILVVDTEEKKENLARRIKVSGNGRCNFFIADLLADAFSEFPLSKLDRFFHTNNENAAKETLSILEGRFGIASFREGKLFYPFFNRSECVWKPIWDAFCESSAAFLSGEVVRIDRTNRICHVHSKDGEREIHYRDIVLASGGISYDRNPEQASFLNSLGIPYFPFSPSLCPVRVKERIPPYLVGNRLRGRISLLADRKEIHAEEGEILFKDDGLSGIAVFNLSLFVNECLRRNRDAFLSFRIDYSSHDGFDGQSCSLAAFPYFLSRYLEERALSPFEPLFFSFSGLYPFRYSQVSYGGLLPESFRNDFALRKDNSFHAIGEALDINLPCGGYNIGFALTSAYILSKALRR